MKNQISLKCKTLYALMIWIVSLYALGIGNIASVQAQAGTTPYQITDFQRNKAGAVSFLFDGGYPSQVNVGAAPNQPVLVSPANGAAGVSTSPSLEVNVSDPDGDDLTVTFYGRPASGISPGEDFTIVAIPDTQHYTDNPNNYANFSAQTQWIVDNKDSRNIVFVTGLGDIVENGNANLSEWNLADGAYSLIEDPITTLLEDGIPYGLSVGNHDQSPNGGGSSASTALYNQFFGESRFAGRSYYGGHQGSNNDNHYELFSASGMDFIIIHFEYDTTPEQAVLDWADNLLTTYSNRRAIVSTHYLIGTGNPASFGVQGQAIYNALQDHPNLFLMVGGHIHGEGRRQDTAVNGNAIYSLLSDYQDYANGGDGWLRIMTFSPANDTIRVQTYSPTRNGGSGDFQTDADSQFTLSYDMEGGPANQVISIRTNVPSGSTVSIPWPNLDHSTEYAWFVTVDDGNAVTTGNTWSFTTIDPPISPPGIFNKSNPTQSATNQLTSLTLSWGASTGAASYEYCYDTTDDNTCSSWTDNGTSTSAAISGLSPATTYYWHVRAVNISGTTYSNDSTTAFWSFTTGSTPPGAFAKSSPVDSATGQSTSPTLSWGTSTGAISYEYCFDTTNDDACSTWTSNGASTSATISGLGADTTYYWHVRAVNTSGTTYANGSAAVFWSFTTAPNPPADFNKTNPPDGATGQSINMTLSWGPSSGTASYEYCLDTTINDVCNDIWASNGTSTSKALTGLNPGTSYEWHVRAVNLGGTTYSNDSGSAFWTFTTAVNPPGAFNKISPSDGTTNQQTAPTLSWSTSSGATSYEYCLDSTINDACNANWLSNGSSTSIVLSGLNPSTPYEWHVRAVNVGGTTYSEGSLTSFWAFTTASNPPGVFAKSSPANGATIQSSSPTLSWGASTGAASYEYCYDTSNDNACLSWTSNGTSTIAALSDLNAGTTYYWHVRAINAGGSTYSNDSAIAFWSFSTIPDPPGAFAKSSPADGVTDQSTITTLSWGASSGATSYEYCYDTTNDNACSSWTSNGAATNTALSGLSPASTYYWHVRAVNISGTTYSNSSATAFWSFTTTTNPPGAFAKSSPADGATGQSISPTLSWGASSSATSYEYCYDTTDDNTCSNWTDNGTSTSAAISGLSPAITYYWHVRATNGVGTTYSNGSTTAFWSFMVDNTAPALSSISRASANPTNLVSVGFTVTFSESVMGVYPANFTLVTGGNVTGASITSVSGSGAIRTVMIDTGSGEGTIGLDMSEGAGITDLVGNALDTRNLPFTGEVYTIQKSGPSVNIGAPNAAFTTTGPVDIEIDIPGAVTVNLQSTDVTLQKTGTADATTVDVIDGDTDNPTIMISGITGDGTIGITIPAGIATDTLGNPSIEAGPSGTFVVDNIAPQIAIDGIDSDAGIIGYDFQVITTNLSQFKITFSEDAYDPPGDSDPQDVTSPDNYLIVRDLGTVPGFQTAGCASPGAVEPDDTRITIESPIVYDNESFTATFTVNSGSPLSNGFYQLYVCGSTSITDWAGMHLAGNGAAGTDFLRSFIVNVPGGGDIYGNGGVDDDPSTGTRIRPVGGLIPMTGFAPNRVTEIPQQPVSLAYSSTGEMRLEIPGLNVNIPIVGVKQNIAGWDLTWLDNDAGYLEGTAYPTWAGNTVLTAHVIDATNTPGPFAHLKDLKDGDRVYIHANGFRYIYQVEKNTVVSAYNTSAVFEHQEYDWLTLVTCENYSNLFRQYNSRRVVKSVLVSVMLER